MREVKEVIVYTSPTCPKCTMLKAYLKNKQIVFEERDINKGSNAQELEVLGISSIPVIKYKGEILVGFNPSEVDKLLAEGDK